MKNQLMVCIDLDKAYDRVPSNFIWWVLRSYMEIIKDMYE